MDPLLFTAPARIRILLVPVHPIKATTFRQKVELVKKFTVVKLGDVTPDMRGVHSMFSSQLFHEGQLLFNFVTSYESEHSYLEEFQMHRRIFGVIGIMDCGEWTNLTDGYKKFTDILKNYPTAVSNRCFAFDPSENQPDDTKGLIMIPNVGNMEFYISTMISDYANNILTEFGNLAAKIEKKSIIYSPKIPTSTSSAFNGIMQNGTPVLPSLTPPSQAMTTVGMGGTTAGANPKDSPFHGRQFSSSTIVNIATQAANVPSTVSDIKVKKRALGRSQKLIADLYLMAGRLPDAVSHYSMAIETTRANGDYLWHGSALEGLCVGLILSAYLHTDVESHILIQSPPSPNPNSPPAPAPESPKALWADITDKYVTVVTLYAKTTSSSSNQVPPLIYTEACLKIAKMLASIWVCGGWGDDALKLIVHGGLPEKGAYEKWGLSPVSNVSKVEVTQWAMKGYGPYVEDMSITEQIHITTTISTIFSIINFRRKHAFFLRQTALLITPLLARPRSGSQAPNKPLPGSDGGLLECLKKVTEVYGVGDVVDSEDFSVVTEDARPLAFGWPDLQMDVLKDAIMVTEALPDYHSIVKYTTRLLRKLFLYLPREEQLRLSSSLPRVVNAGKKQGLDMEFKYWGLNIVRGIQVCRPTSRRIPYPHPGKGIENDTEKPADPFLYKSFNVAKAETIQTFLVANEAAYFLVTLANPFSFDLDIQSISVSTEGVGFVPNPMVTVITANTSVTLRISGTPTEPGQLIVRGCKIKVHGCLEQEFCVYLPPNEEEIKKKEREEEYSKRIKKCGLAVLNRSNDRRDLQSADQTKAEQKEYVSEFLKVTVIVDQPLVKIKSTSLMHGAAMLFEGERTEMTMKLENVGKTPVDYISLSFQDSTIAAAQALLKSSDIPAEEAYEMELYAHKQPVFSWEQSEIPFNILPAEECTLTIILYGKRGCVSGTIQIDYGYLKRPDYNDKDVFYTRQVYYPVLLTVHQNLDPVSMDILNFTPLNIPDNPIHINGTNDTIDGFYHTELIEDLIKLVRWNKKTKGDHKSIMENDYCLLTFDIRNVWHIGFDVTIEANEGEEFDPICITSTIQPSATSRILLPIRKIFLSEREYTEPIPSSKQFVVSKEPRRSLEQENTQLALFWYRENLLKKVKAYWKCPLTNQKGTVDIRSLRLNKSMLNVLKVNEISFGVEIEEAQKVSKLSCNQFRCPVNKFVKVNFIIHNNQEKSSKLCIRIQPVQSYTDEVMEWDLSRRMVWNGLLQSPLPKIEAKSSITYTLPMCFFSRGDFKFLYHCEDVFTRTMYFDTQPLLIEVVDD
ncbi:13226_t:CDS:10 [Acaulospora morrowiae]|uniref:13226_t:CDS:1 n=1 Tax=Acaulospora morrowiae TaxID=94023 RepID=A0A9N8VN65_9GLOM|nr:13226_t:CDS:10 [Acaulospora morrowiae]